MLPKEILYGLHVVGIHTLDQATKDTHQDQIISCWQNVETLASSKEYGVEWDEYIMGLRKKGISLSNEEDMIIWTWNKHSGTITTKQAYYSLWVGITCDRQWWFMYIWKLQVPLKLNFFYDQLSTISS